MNARTHTSSSAQDSTTLPQSAVASAIWLVGEWGSQQVKQPVFSKVVEGNLIVEIVRLLSLNFASFDSDAKLQCVHLSSKFRLSSNYSTVPVCISLCEYIIEVGKGEHL